MQYNIRWTKNWEGATIDWVGWPCGCCKLSPSKDLNAVYKFLADNINHKPKRLGEVVGIKA